MSRIISIQSHVLHGHVGNAAAVPAMTMLGAEVTSIPTTLLSNHPHYPTMRGQVLDAALVADLLLGIEERGLIADAALLLTGFLGSPSIGRVVLDFVVSAKRSNPDLIYICDPVLGDDDLGGFADSDLAELFRDHLAPLAQLITPNRWEAFRLSGVEPGAGDRQLLEALRRQGYNDIVVTGGHAKRDPLRTLVLEGKLAWTIDTPRLSVRPAGTGDFLTGLLAAQLASGSTLIEATTKATAMTFALLMQTPSNPWAELPIRACLADIEKAAPALKPTLLGKL